MAEHVPGVHVAALLFDKGFWFDAVVRGLVLDRGFSSDEAREAAIAATAKRLRGNRTQLVSLATLHESRMNAVEQMA
jgi:hypothetical protein